MCACVRACLRVCVCVRLQNRQNGALVTVEVGVGHRGLAAGILVVKSFRRGDELNNSLWDKIKIHIFNHSLRTVNNFPCH